MKYQIKYSGVGDRIEDLNWEEVEATSLQDAENQAYMLACHEFHSYSGLHGIGMKWDDYFEEFPDNTEDDYYNFMAEECENWVTYEARSALPHSSKGYDFHSVDIGSSPICGPMLLC